VGIIVPDLAHSFFAELTRGIYEKARASGYETIIMVHDENEEIEKRNLQFLSALNVDGILFASAPGEANIKLIKQIRNRGIPFVFFDRIIEGFEFCSVTIDDEAAALKLMDKFLKAGRKKLVFIGPLDDLFVAKGRYKGYVNALNKYNIAYLPELVINCRTTIEDANTKMRKFLQSKLSFDGVICVSGLIAYGAGKAILEAGLSIPQDVMLAEFGDNDVVHRLGVPFLTVVQYPHSMGEKSVELIVDIIDKKEQTDIDKHLYLDTQIISHHFVNASRTN